MERWRGKVAVVNGASAGIGSATTLTLAKHGMRVVAMARSLDKLEKLASRSPGDKIYPIKCDITDEASVVEAFAEVKHRFGAVDVLVNSAGLYNISGISDGDADVWLKVLKTNVFGYATSCREALKMMDKKEGHIVNLNSVLGHCVINVFKSPIGIYPASKHAVTALTKSLRFELRSTGSTIKVTSISPGLVKTDMGSKVVDSINVPAEAAQSATGGALTPQNVADAIVSVISADTTVEIQELTMQDSSICF